jgi:hypothetical protein
MSLNTIAASTPKRRTGCSVISAATSGVRTMSRKPARRARTAWYSGR